MTQQKESKADRGSIDLKCKNYQSKEARWIERIENKKRLLKF